MLSKSLAIRTLAFVVFAWSSASLAAIDLTQFDPGSTVGDVSDAQYQIVNDEQTVVYVAQDGVAPRDLFAVRIDNPGNPINLSNLSNAARNVVILEASADSQYVVYAVRSGDPINGTEQLYSARIDGVGNPVALTDPIPLFTANFLEALGVRFEISSDSQHVVYVENSLDPITQFPQSQLRSVPIASGTSASITLSEVVDSITFELSLDGQTVAFTEADLSMGMLGGRLRTVSTAGGSVSEISEPGDLVYDFEIARNNQRIAFAALQADQSSVLASATLLGSNLIELDALPAPGTMGDPTAILLQVTPDSQRVVYVYTDAFQSSQLRSISIDGGQSTLLDPQPGTDGNLILQFQISPNSEWIVYGRPTAESPLAGNELFGVRSDGGAPVQLNSPLSGDGLFLGFITRNSERVVFGRTNIVSGLPDPAGFAEIYSTAINGSGNPVRVNAPLTPGGHVLFFFPYFDSQRVLYIADQIIDDQFEIFEATIDGSGAQRLNDPLFTQGDVAEGFFTRSNERVLYRADQDHEDVYNLFITDGTAPSGEVVFVDGFEAP